MSTLYIWLRTFHVRQQMSPLFLVHKNNTAIFLYGMAPSPENNYIHYLQLNMRRRATYLLNMEHMHGSKKEIQVGHLISNPVSRSVE